MNKYFLTSQIVDDLAMLDCVGDEQELIDAAMSRLQTLEQHIRYLTQRINLAEKVIGELHLTHEEATR